MSLYPIRRDKFKITLLDQNFNFDCNCIIYNILILFCLVRRVLLRNIKMVDIFICIKRMNISDFN